MNAARQVQRTPLRKRELVAIDDASDHLLLCETGELWLTCDGDSRDVILKAGQSWSATGRGPVVVSACEPSVLALTHRPSCEPTCAPHRQGAESVVNMIRRWRFPALASFPATHIL
jgi:hypothetical protein